MSTDIAIDLGTSRTRIYVSTKGIVIDEPTVVAVDIDKDEIIAVGDKAYKMLGRTSQKVMVTYPLEGGVISNFYLVESLISQFLKKINLSKIVMPKVIACIPGEITEVEKMSVVNTISSVGARKVCLMEETIAAAMGAGINVKEPNGNLVVDIGAGTTNIGIISLGGLSVSKCIKIAGNTIDNEIIKYVKKNYSMLIGKKMAQETKIAIGSLYPKDKDELYRIKGKDLITGLPKWIDISSSEVMDAILGVAMQIIREIQDVLEEAPPELAGDIYSQGIVLTGGTSLINGFDKLIAKKTRLEVHVVEEPELCVVRGAGMALKYIDSMSNKEYGIVSPLSVEY